MMKLTRWSPNADLTALHDEVNCMFDSFLGGRPFGACGADHGRAWMPPVDIRESNDDFFVRMDLPGADKKNIKVSVYGDTLTVRGERHEEAGQEDTSWLRVERSHGAFERQFKLGAAVQGDKVSAVYKDGVLELRIPKAEAARLREIPIQESGS